MTYSKGTNQYKIKGAFTMLEKILLVIIIFYGGSFFIKDPVIVSPVPEVIRKVSASDTQKMIDRAFAHEELKKKQEEENRPTKANIIAYIAKVFENEGTAVQVRAINCFYSESGLRTDAVSPTNKNGTIDRGVAQINSIHGMKPEDAHDFKKNIDKAYQIYKRRGFSAWYGKACK